MMEVFYLGIQGAWMDMKLEMILVSKRICEMAFRAMLEVLAPYHDFVILDHRSSLQTLLILCCP